ncbi:unnamed protein product [Zymoseptoria tritici ST99CH_1E4]|uniref:Uncharacterized protein n=1 Tax=Zymoseptoria tritici ST99CH_1E4 TaxID=1276532 RepID=A0A2H1GQE2_ZYMTR|nr:unnamed protein product [Zymoseptoria tritici ST99CH_1E4]
MDIDGVASLPVELNEIILTSLSPRALFIAQKTRAFANTILQYQHLQASLFRNVLPIRLSSPATLVRLNPILITSVTASTSTCRTTSAINTNGLPHFTCRFPISSSGMSIPVRHSSHSLTDADTVFEAWRGATFSTTIDDLSDRDAYRSMKRAISGDLGKMPITSPSMPTLIIVTFNIRLEHDLDMHIHRFQRIKGAIRMGAGVTVEDLFRAAWEVAREGARVIGESVEDMDNTDVRTWDGEELGGVHSSWERKMLGISTFRTKQSEFWEAGNEEEPEQRKTAVLPPTYAYILSFAPDLMNYTEDSVEELTYREVWRWTRGAVRSVHNRKVTDRPLYRAKQADEFNSGEQEESTGVGDVLLDEEQEDGASMWT